MRSMERSLRRSSYSSYNNSTRSLHSDSCQTVFVEIPLKCHGTAHWQVVHFSSYECSSTPWSVRLGMVNSNTVIVDRSSQAADPRLEKTTNSRSLDIQEINEDIHQTHKIYLQNCGTVYMPLTVDSFNARGVRMENCGNNVPQVTCLLSFHPHFLFSFNLAILHYSDHRPKIIGNERVIHSQSHAVSSGGMWTLALHYTCLNMSSFRSAKCDGPSDSSDRNRHWQE